MSSTAIRMIVGLMGSSFEWKNLIASVAQTCPIGKSKSFIYNGREGYWKKRNEDPNC